MFSFNLSAQEVSKLPPYCAHYPSFKDGVKISKNQQDKKLIAYQNCHEGSSVKYVVDDLAKMVQDVELKTLDTMGEQFKTKLSYHGVKQVLEKKSSYLNLFPSLANEEIGDLNNCLESSPKTSSNDHLYNPAKAVIASELEREQLKKSGKINPKNQLNFHKSNIKKSMIASILFEKNKNHYNDLDFVSREKSWAKNECISIQNKCFKKAGFTGTRKHCVEDYNFCIEVGQFRKEAKVDKLNKKILPLYSMVSTSPLLFDNTKEGSIFSMFSDDKLGPSTLMDKINIKMKLEFPKSAKEKLNKLYDENDLVGIDNFFKEHDKIIERMANSKYIQNETTKELKNELERLNTSAASICEGKGEKLHHYPGLVNAALKESYDDSFKSGQLKEKVAENQAAYCHLLNKEPLSPDGISPALIGGFAMLGVGAALQLVPFFGTISGGALITVGTGLATVGGAGLAGMGVYDTMKMYDKLNTEVGLHSAGFHEYSKLLKTKDIRDGDAMWVIADAILLGVDLKTMKTLTSGNKSRKISGEGPEYGQRYNHELRLAIDEVDDGMKEVTKANLLTKYNKGDYQNLTSHPADQIYYAALADMIQTDIKTSRRGLHKKQLEKETRRVLNSIIKKCNPVGKKP